MTKEKFFYDFFFIIFTTFFFNYNKFSLLLCEFNYSLFSCCVNCYFSNNDISSGFSPSFVLIFSNINVFTEEFSVYAFTTDDLYIIKDESP